MLAATALAEMGLTEAAEIYNEDHDDGQCRQRRGIFYQRGLAESGEFETARQIVRDGKNP
jgi:hypothetical protein